MWGWEDNACIICGAPWCMCDCHEQLKAINGNLKAIRNRLIQDLREEREKVFGRRNYVSPEFLTALRAQDARRPLLRALAAEIPEVIVHESFFAGEITEEESAEIYRLRDEANVSWLRRWWRGLWEE